MVQQPPRFPDVAVEAAAVATPLQGDEYLGKTQIVAARMFLERRKATGLGPGTPTEIYEGILAGGYRFDTDDIANRKRGLGQALSKNTAIFHRLDNGKIGLVAWYPGLRVKKPAESKANGANTEQVGEEQAGDAPQQSPPESEAEAS